MALATALERVGISCEVYEQASEIREVGAGLTLWSNALIALERLGAAERVIALGSTEDRFEVRNASGQVLAVTPVARAWKRFGLPGCVCVHRVDLLRELVSHSRNTPVHVGSRCVGIREEADHVIAQFANGVNKAGDFLVGADGLYSLVREQLFGQSKPRYAGYTCWRGFAVLEPVVSLPPKCAFEAWGSGRRFSIHPCGPGRLFWFATHNEPAGGTDGPRGRRADVQELFASWHEPIPSVIAATSEILRNDILDRVPTRTWGRGRITLLGDAAHPTTPNLGQGACQALEDAVVLANQLRHQSDVQAALRTYENLRQPRTNLITTESFRIGRITQSENRMVRWLTKMAVQLMPRSASWRFMERFLSMELPVLE
jgi:2-polyprenyl-6-methoxyphenol hydroxylase-like FAD-dependent oxidoreductase